MDDRLLEDLVASIAELGLLQPIIVKRLDDGTFEVIAGHRRLLALRRLNWAACDCYLKDEDDADVAVTIHENVEREELNPADEAIRYMELFGKLQDTEKVAELVKKPQDYVERRMNLLYNADSEVFEALRLKKIAIGIAEEINKMVKEADRAYHLHFAKTTGSTVRQMRDYRIRANESAKREAELAGKQGESPAEEQKPKPTAPPAPQYTHYVEPWQLSSEIAPRPCLFCQEQHPEHTMFRHYVCGRCADEKLLPIERRERS